MSFDKPVYPFSAIVGQDGLKLPLILNAIDPSIGGVLLSGPKGTGKSLTVRALTEILPEVEAVEGCVFNCSPSDPTNMCENCQSTLKAGLPVKRRKMRLVQIPIGATEDRVIGTMDVEKALQQGVRSLQPGLLAEANQGILYIDEVNLLPDHIVDAILDAASSGFNMVEREGVSVTHPARFMLVGSMNPEEGELRPQILDRFGLSAKAANITDAAERVRIIQANDEFLKDPLAFRAKYEEEQREIVNRIEAARKLLSRVRVSQSVLDSVAKICTDLKVDGYRPDIVMVKAAKAHAALNGRDEASIKDVLVASELTLTHRTRMSGLAPPPSAKEIKEALETTSIVRASRSTVGQLRALVSKRSIREAVLSAPARFAAKILNIFIPLMLLVAFFTLASSSSFQGTDWLKLLLVSGIMFLIITLMRLRKPRRANVKLLDFSRLTSEQTSGPQTIVEENDEPRTTQHDVDYQGSSTLESGPAHIGNVLDPLEPKSIPPPKLQHARQEERPRRGSYYLVGKRAKIVTSSSRGRYVWHEPPSERPFDIAFGPTLRAAAPHQLSRRTSSLAVSIESGDLRVKMREYRAPFSIILLVDMSLSMAVSIANLGRAILSLHRSVYRRRDRVGLIVFKGSEAVVLQHPTTNLDLIVQKLWKVGTSDFTPMAAGMFKARNVLKLEKQRNKDVIPMLIVVSDGIVNIPLPRPLSARVNRRLLSDAQSDVLDVARLLARDKVRLIAINTAHRREELSIEARKKVKPPYALLYTPTNFLMELAKVAKGSYYGLSLKRDEELTSGTKLERWFYFE